MPKMRNGGYRRAQRSLVGLGVAFAKLSIERRSGLVDNPFNRHLRLLLSNRHHSPNSSLYSLLQDTNVE